MADPTPDPADVELVARALAAEDVHWGYDHGFWVTDTTTDPETDAFARAVLRALATAGRLLPAALDGDALLELATPLLAEALPMPLDLDVISREWLRVCGACDYGMPAGCACPDEDPRSVISRLSAELERIRAERDDAYGQGRDDEADGAPMRYPSTRRRVPTQAERIAAARADGHHRITEDERMTDRYGETLDLIATAVETATDDTLRDSIRSMIRQVRPEALDLWSPTLAHRPTTTEETA